MVHICWKLWRLPLHEGKKVARTRLACSKSEKDVQLGISASKTSFTRSIACVQMEAHSALSLSLCPCVSVCTRAKACSCEFMHFELRQTNTCGDDADSGSTDDRTLNPVESRKESGWSFLSFISKCLICVSALILLEGLWLKTDRLYVLPCLNLLDPNSSIGQTRLLLLLASARIMSKV